MEEIQPGGNRARTSIVIVLLSILVVAITVSLLKYLTHSDSDTKQSVAKITSSAIAQQIVVSVKDSEGNDVAAGQSRFVSKGSTSSSAATSVSDSSSSSTAKSTIENSSSQSSSSAKLPIAEVSLQKSPIAVSISSGDPSSLIAWLNENPKAHSLLNSDLVTGALSDVFSTLKVRAEDLKLSGFSGFFLQQLIKDVVAAHGVLSYDISRAKRGFVLSFITEESSYAKRLLPLLIEQGARRQLVVDSLEEPIYELILGRQTIFITRDGPRTLVGASLGVLLNILDQGVPSATTSDETLKVTFHADAFLDHVMRAFTSKSDLTVSWIIKANASGIQQTLVDFSDAHVFKFFKPKFADGALAAIPANSTVALATSLLIPAGITDQDWQILASKDLPSKQPDQAKEGGVSIIWDINAAATGLGDVGYVLALGSPVSAETQEKFKAYFSDSTTVGTCAGDTVYLSATSETLFKRMQDACNRQSSSLLSLREKQTTLLDQNDQFAVLFSPKEAIQELVQAGRVAAVEETENSENPPAWKKLYREAVERAQANAKSTSDQLSQIIFHGPVSPTHTVLKGNFLE